jgi:hypothetical protein
VGWCGLNGPSQWLMFVLCSDWRAAVVSEKRMDRMIQIARETGRTLDSVVAAMARADQSTFEALSANPSLLPK